MRRGVPLLLLVLGVGAPALGAMVKYRLPDGRVGYASPGRIPPGAIVEKRDYRPGGHLTRPVWRNVEPTGPRAPTSAPAARVPDAAERRTQLAQEKWSRKAKRARDDLARAERELRQWRLRCRGEDDRHSLYEVPPGCTSHEKEELDAATERVAEARAWLEDGLFDACRRDEECLPGYIR